MVRATNARGDCNSLAMTESIGAGFRTTEETRIDALRDIDDLRDVDDLLNVENLGPFGPLLKLNLSKGISKSIVSVVDSRLPR